MAWGTRNSEESVEEVEMSFLSQKKVIDIAQLILVSINLATVVIIAFKSIFPQEQP